MTRQIFLTIVGLALTFFFASNSLLLGAVTGELAGLVLDAKTGEPIADAEVVVVREGTDIPRITSTDSKGSYLVELLLPGTYSVTARKGGYQEVKRPEIQVVTAQVRNIVPDIKLSPLVAGLEQEKIEPIKESLLNTRDAAYYGTFEDKTITALPLGGVRNPDDLALQLLGVLLPPASAGKGPGVGPGIGTSGQFSVNGQRARSNNFTIDGSDNNDPEIGVRRQGFVSLTPQSVDSIQNFQVRSRVYNAEYGRNSGANVDIVSKSGGNDIHGSIFGFLTNQRLNARDFFNTRFSDTVNTGQRTSVLNLPTSPGNNGGRSNGKDPFTRAQYGFAVGGPILKDKTFFFGSFEQQRIEESVQSHFAVPPELFRGFICCVQLPTGITARLTQGPGLTFPNPHPTPAGAAVLNLYPFPNNPNGPYGIFNYTKVLPADADGSVFSIKVDHNISTKNVFVARYNFTDDHSIIPVTGSITSPSPAINSSVGTDTRTQDISLLLNSIITSSIANQIRFSYGRTRLNFLEQKNSPFIFQSQATVSVPGIGQPITGFTGPLGQLIISPYSPIGVDVFNFPQSRADNTFQSADTFSYQRGGHYFKAGFDIRRYQLNSLLDRNFRPLATFAGSLNIGQVPVRIGRTSITPPVIYGIDFAALGAATGVFQTISTQPIPDSHIGLRFTELDFFVQDNWKVHPRVTIDFGIRYELNTVPKEAHKRIERTFTLANIPSFDPNQLDPSLSEADRREVEQDVQFFNNSLAALRGILGGRTRIYDANYNNVAPRFGVALRINDKTVLRGGYGIFYDQIIGSVTSQSKNVFPTFIPINFAPGFFFDPDRIPVVINNPAFFGYTGARGGPVPLIRPGTLNGFGIPPGLFIPAVGTLFRQNNRSLPGTQAGNGLSFTLPVFDLRTPYAQHFNLTFERELFTDTVFSIAYVGSRGVRLTRFRTPNGGINAVGFVECSDPSSCAFAQPNSTSPGGTRAGRPIPTLGGFTIFENSAASIFHSMQVAVNRRLSRGFQFSAAWTYSHTIDDVSDMFNGLGFFILPQNDNNLREERVSASFDARHRFAFNYVWELPVFKQDKILGGWRVAGITVFQTGQPFTVNTEIDVNRDGNLNDRLNTTAGLTINNSGRDRIQGAPLFLIDRAAIVRFIVPLKDGAVGRNTFRAPGIANFDIAVLKGFKITENKSIEFRTEFFNAFNRTHFGIPVRILEAPAFGSSVNTFIRPRNIQFALKFLF